MPKSCIHLLELKQKINLNYSVYHNMSNDADSSENKCFLDDDKKQLLTTIK